MLDRACLIPPFDNVIGILKSLSHIAITHAAALVAFIKETVGAPTGENRRAWLEGLFTSSTAGSSSRSSLTLETASVAASSVSATMAAICSPL